MAFEEAVAAMVEERWLSNAVHPRQPGAMFYVREGQAVCFLLYFFFFLLFALRLPLPSLPSFSTILPPSLPSYSSSSSSLPFVFLLLLLLTFSCTIPCINSVPSLSLLILTLRFFQACALNKPFIWASELFLLRS